MPGKIKTILLDFDGVIVESNGIKDQAFKTILQRYPDHFDSLWQYHITQNAVDRHAKFGYFVRQILGKDDTVLRDQLLSEFTALTDSAINVCPFVQGAVEFLQFFSEILPLHLSSATPDANLGKILATRNLTRFFKTISGSGEKKEQAVQRILRDYSLEPSDIFFIGDSPEDFQVATATGIRFGTRISERFNAATMPAGWQNLHEALFALREMT